MMYWWCIDDVLMMYWWCIDDVLMMYWWFIDDLLMMYWWCIDDVLMIYWWFIDDLFMICWWFIDDKVGSGSRGKRTPQELSGSFFNVKTRSQHSESMMAKHRSRVSRKGRNTEQNAGVATLCRSTASRSAIVSRLTKGIKLCTSRDVDAVAAWHLKPSQTSFLHIPPRCLDVRRWLHWLHPDCISLLTLNISEPKLLWLVAVGESSIKFLEAQPQSFDATRTLTSAHFGTHFWRQTVKVWFQQTLNILRTLANCPDILLPNHEFM